LKGNKLGLGHPAPSDKISGLLKTMAVVALKKEAILVYYLIIKS